MKVGFDISQTAHPGGVANYTKNLTEELQKEKELDMVFFFSSLRKRYHGNLKNVKKFRLPPSLFEVLFNKLRNVPIEKFLGPIDVFHSSDWVQPPTKAKKVTTYHDVIPLKFPEWSHPKIVTVQKQRLNIVEKEVDIVIAVSKNTKKDLLEISNIPEEKIVVIPEGVEKRFKPQKEEDIQKFKKKYELPEEFVLAMGGVGKRKNLAKIKEASQNYNLVIPGENIPYIPDEELPLLFSSAKVLVYASLYEGFGLPILESMACGTPIVSSYNSSIPEVGGKAVLYANPEDVRSIQKRLEQAYSDENWRKTLIKEGLKQSARFSWEKNAKETVKVYQSLMEL